jgi:tRNA-Thr(GGU) m(6)t(6)A37 methyltransferase TsaA
MAEPLILTPIGIIRTPYHDRYAAPRQPGADERSADGTIILDKGKNFEQALEGLEGVEKIWVIYHFDRNKNWKPKVLTPRGGREKKGVFATRSPHRPNPIGLSLLTLLEIKGRRLRVAGVDILDGTPILDIKPYLPFVEAFPNAKAGWLGELRSEPQYVLEWGKKALEEARKIEKDRAPGIVSHIERVLSLDPLPHPYRRIKAQTDSKYELAYKYWRIGYEIKGNSVHIFSVISVE